MHPATVLYEKGFDNMLMLSGGIEGFTEKFYDMLEGEKLPPKPVEKEAEPQKTFKRKELPSQADKLGKKKPDTSKRTADMVKEKQVAYNKNPSKPVPKQNSKNMIPEMDDQSLKSNPYSVHTNTGVSQLNKKKTQEVTGKVNQKYISPE